MARCQTRRQQQCEPGGPLPTPPPPPATPAPQQDPFAAVGGVDSKGDGMAATSMLTETADEDIVFA
jgi:hypothetical protein